MADSEQDAPRKYVPPHVRRAMEQGASGGGGGGGGKGSDSRDRDSRPAPSDRWAGLDRDRDRYDDRRDDRRGGKGGYDDRRGGGGRYDDRDRRDDRRDFDRRDDRRGDDRRDDRRDKPVSDRWAGLDSRDDGPRDRRGPSGPRGSGNSSWETRDGRKPVYEEVTEVYGSEHMGVSSGIKFDEYDKIPVEMSGEGFEDIHPIDRFKDADMHPAILENIERMKYSRPTPVQKHAIPVIISGRDLMACAQTGSGKTAAFLFPTIQRMLKDGPPANGGDNRRRRTAPVCLCMAPTRELVSQIYDEARKFTFQSGMRAVCVYGGAEIRNQMRELERGCDILVATPGRLSDLIERGKVTLQCINFLIFDEADRMLDMGFEPQIRRIVEDEDMSPDRQTIMFSATFPKEIQQLARDFLNNYIFLTVGRVGSTNENISQNMRYVEDSMKQKYLIKILEEQTEEGLTLVFVETKKRADELEYYLRRDRFPATSIHGDRSQWEREEALKLFKNGELPILVATDVAARGLDISNVNHVINYDLPNSIDDYVHRIGRTGRAGNVGRATSFVNENSRAILRELCQLLEEANQEIPTWFEQLVYQSGNSMGGRYGGRGKGGGRGASNMGARDIREGGSRTVYTHSRGDGDNWRSTEKKVSRAPEETDNTAF